MHILHPRYLRNPINQPHYLRNSIDLLIER